MKTTDEFDEILSDALNPYRDAEPLAGLGDRVLRRVQQQSRRRKMRGRSFAAGLATALLGVAAWIELRGPSYRPLIEPTTIQQVSPPPDTGTNLSDIKKLKPDKFPSEVFERSRPERVPAKPTDAVAARRSIESMFPVPTPLTSEERALLALARVNPEALRTLPRSDGELAIAPIAIQPLASTGGDNQGDN